MGLGLKGHLPQNLNKLSKLTNLGLQKNQFSGKLPSFSGLSELKFAYLNFIQFDTIPSDFFGGLVSLQVLALDENPLNVTSGWLLPDRLQDSAQLINCNLVGPLPEFLGTMSSLEVLLLSTNRLSGPIPDPPAPTPPPDPLDPTPAAMEEDPSKKMSYKEVTEEHSGLNLGNVEAQLNFENLETSTVDYDGDLIQLTDEDKQRLYSP
ncbi:hypothetical protein BC332_20588 [Capsicum chinense]|nr:hypothetical protein BC332_20588 [Capsicum chinense]